MSTIYKYLVFLLALFLLWCTWFSVHNRTWCDLVIYHVPCISHNSRFRFSSLHITLLGQFGFSDQIPLLLPFQLTNQRYLLNNSSGDEEQITIIGSIGMTPFLYFTILLPVKCRIDYLTKVQEFIKKSHMGHKPSLDRCG